MSTIYYIVDKNKQDKYENLCKFLKEESRKIINDFNEFGRKYNYDSISDEVDYEIRSLLDSLKYKLEPESIRFGQSTFRGFTFFNDFTCCGIKDIESLKQYMCSNIDCIIEDECGEKFTIEKFIEKIGNIEIY